MTELGIFVGYGIVSGERINCKDYEVQMNRLNQIIPNTPIKIRTKDNDWLTVDGHKLYLFK